MNLFSVSVEMCFAPLSVLTPAFFGGVAHAVSSSSVDMEFALNGHRLFLSEWFCSSKVIGFSWNVSGPRPCSVARAFFVSMKTLWRIRF